MKLSYQKTLPSFSMRQTSKCYFKNLLLKLLNKANIVNWNKKSWVRKDHGEVHFNVSHIKCLKQQMFIQQMLVIQYRSTTPFWMFLSLSLLHNFTQKSLNSGSVQV